MLKKLRRKIIMGNVLLVSLVLVIVFSVFCLSSYQSGLSELQTGLWLSVVGGPDNDGLEIYKPNIGGAHPGDRHQPVTATVTVLVDDSGQILHLNENGATIDDDVLSAALSMALAAEEDSGHLAELRLMFCRLETPFGVRVGFADTSSITVLLHRSIFACVILFAFSMGVMLLISLWLSGLAVRPIAKAWTQQKQFIADASHELKTPLTVILANNNILLAHSDEPVAAQRQWLESTEDEAQRMRQLIDQMLTLARTDVEQHQPRLAALDISVLVEEQLLYFEPLAFEKQVQIVSSIQPGLHALGDEQLLRQLVKLLLDNAIKYSPELGTIHVELCGSNNQVQLGVNNQGTPIPPDDLPHIFDRFYRANKARDDEGYGLGLAIAQNIVHALGGRISAASTAEQGTTFTVVLKSAAAAK